MKLTLQENAVIDRAKAEIASEYGVEDFEDIDRGNVSSRANGDLTRTLVEMAEEQISTD